MKLTCAIVYISLLLPYFVHCVGSLHRLVRAENKTHSNEDEEIEERSIFHTRLLQTIIKTDCCLLPRYMQRCDCCPSACIRPPPITSCCSLPRTSQNCRCCPSACPVLYPWKPPPLLLPPPPLRPLPPLPPLLLPPPPPPPRCCHLPIPYINCACCPSACVPVFPLPPNLPPISCCHMPRPYLNCYCCPAACQLIPLNESCCNKPPDMQACHCCPNKCSINSTVSQTLPTTVINDKSTTSSSNKELTTATTESSTTFNCCHLPKEKQNCDCCLTFCSDATSTDLQTTTRKSTTKPTKKRTRKPKMTMTTTLKSTTIQTTTPIPTITTEITTATTTTATTTTATTTNTKTTSTTKTTAKVSTSAKTTETSTHPTTTKKSTKKQTATTKRQKTNKTPKTTKKFTISTTPKTTISTLATTTKENCCDLPEEDRNCDCCPSSCTESTVTTEEIAATTISSTPSTTPFSCCHLPKQFRECKCCPSDCDGSSNLPEEETESCCNWPKNLQRCDCCPASCSKAADRINIDCCDFPLPFRNCKCCPQKCPSGNHLIHNPNVPNNLGRDLYYGKQGIPLNFKKQTENYFAHPLYNNIRRYIPVVGHAVVVGNDDEPVLLQPEKPCDDNRRLAFDINYLKDLYSESSPALPIEDAVDYRTSGIDNTTENKLKEYHMDAFIPQKYLSFVFVSDPSRKNFIRSIIDHPDLFLQRGPEGILAFINPVLRDYIIHTENNGGHILYDSLAEENKKSTKSRRSVDNSIAYEKFSNILSEKLFDLYNKKKELRYLGYFPKHYARPASNPITLYSRMSNGCDGHRSLQGVYGYLPYDNIFKFALYNHPETSSRIVFNKNDRLLDDVKDVLLVPLEHEVSPFDGGEDKFYKYHPENLITNKEALSRIQADDVDDANDLLQLYVAPPKNWNNLNLLDNLAKLATGVVANHGEVEFSPSNVDFRNFQAFLDTDSVIYPHHSSHKHHPNKNSNHIVTLGELEDVIRRQVTLNNFQNLGIIPKLNLYGVGNAKNQFRNQFNPSVFHTTKHRLYPLRLKKLLSEKYLIDYLKSVENRYDFKEDEKHSVNKKEVHLHANEQLSPDFQVLPKMIYTETSIPNIGAKNRSNPSKDLIGLKTSQEKSQDIDQKKNHNIRVNRDGFSTQRGSMLHFPFQRRHHLSFTNRKKKATQISFRDNLNSMSIPMSSGVKYISSVEDSFQDSFNKNHFLPKSDLSHSENYFLKKIDNSEDQSETESQWPIAYGTSGTKTLFSSDITNPTTSLNDLESSSVAVTTVSPTVVTTISDNAVTHFSKENQEQQVFNYASYQDPASLIIILPQFISLQPPSYDPHIQPPFAFPLQYCFFSQLSQVCKNVISKNSKSSADISHVDNSKIQKLYNQLEKLFLQNNKFIGNIKGVNIYDAPLQSSQSQQMVTNNNNLLRVSRSSGKHSDDQYKEVPENELSINQKDSTVSQTDEVMENNEASYTTLKL